MITALENSQVSNPFDVVQNMHLYLTTDQRFNAALHRPVWLTPSKVIANDYVYTLSCEGNSLEVDVYSWKGGKVALLADYKKHIVSVWPEYESSNFVDDINVFSFFNMGYGQYSITDIQKFISLLQADGFDAAIHEDYACDDYTNILCVFDAQKSLELTNINFEVQQNDE
jgi:hypothetical protein